MFIEVTCYDSKDYSFDGPVTWSCSLNTAVVETVEETSYLGVEDKECSGVAITMASGNTLYLTENYSAMRRRLI